MESYSPPFMALAEVKKRQIAAFYKLDSHLLRQELELAAGAFRFLHDLQELVQVAGQANPQPKATQSSPCRFAA